MTHILMVWGTGDKLYLSPLTAQKAHRILDVGTGTGIWAIEMGELFPAAEVSLPNPRTTILRGAVLLTWSD